MLLSGTTGVGKSTLATMAAHRLGITRVIATDVIRQVLRASFARDFMPAVHSSAVEVDMAGYAEQAEAVGTGITAIVERACSEGTPIVIEGVPWVVPRVAAQVVGRSFRLKRTRVGRPRDDVQRCDPDVRRRRQRGDGVARLDRVDEIRDGEGLPRRAPGRRGAPPDDRGVAESAI